MGWVDFSCYWSGFVKEVELDIATLVDSKKFEIVCHEYVKDNNLDVNIIEKLESDRKLKLAQMSD